MIRYLLFLFLTFVLAQPSFATEYNGPLLDGDPLWDVIQSHLPGDPNDVRAYSYATGQETCLVVTYCYDAVMDPAAGTTIRAYELLAGTLSDGEFNVELTELADTDENGMLRVYRTYDKIEFVSLPCASVEIPILALLSHESGVHIATRTPELRAVNLVIFSFLQWSPGAHIDYGTLCDFEFSPELEGIVVWQSCALDNAGRFPPFRITQSLYQLDQTHGFEFFEVRRMTTDGFFDDLPSEPPFDWEQ